MGKNKIEKEEYVRHGWSLREDVEGKKNKMEIKACSSHLEEFILPQNSV